MLYDKFIPNFLVTVYLFQIVISVTGLGAPMILSFGISVAGISSKSTTNVDFQGSPVAAGVTDYGLISIQFPNPAAISNGPGSESPKYVLQFICLLTLVWFIIVLTYL